MSTWAWISRRIEKDFLKMSVGHVDMIIKVAEGLLEMIRCMKQGKRDCAVKAYEKVFNDEREADNIKRKIITELSKGIIHPINREELIRLVLSADDVAAYSKASARRLLVVLNLGLSIDEETLTIIEKMAERNFEATRRIKEAIEALIKDVKKALRVADVIERIEEEVDDIRMEALELVLSKCHKEIRSISLCILLKDVVDSIEDSVDRCEDVADVVRSIAVLS